MNLIAGLFKLILIVKIYNLNLIVGLSKLILIVGNYKLNLIAGLVKVISCVKCRTTHDHKLTPGGFYMANRRAVKLVPCGTNRENIRLSPRRSH